MAVELLAASDVTVVKSEASTTSPVSTAYDSGSTGSDRLLVVGVVYEDGGGGTRKRVSGITYNGVALTARRQQLSGSSTDENTEIWTLASPASGSNTLAVSFSDPTLDNRIIIVAAVYTGVGSVGATAGATAIDGASDTVTDLALTFTDPAGYGVILLGMSTSGMGPIDSVSGWTVDHEDEQGAVDAGSAVALGHYQTDSASAKTFTWSPGASTVSTRQWAGVAIELIPAASASISVDDDTIDPHPDTVVVIEKSEAWSGTVTATIEGAPITLTDIDTTHKSFTLDIDDLLPGGAWNAISPLTTATLAVTDDDGTYTTEVQIVFSPSTGEDYVASPGANIGTHLAVPGAVIGDPHFGFWHTGDGARDKTILGQIDAGTGDFQPISLPAQGRLIAYSESGSAWLDYVDTAYFNIPASGGDAVVRSPLRGVVQSIIYSVVE